MSFARDSLFSETNGDADCVRRQLGNEFMGRPSGVYVCVRPIRIIAREPTFIFNDYTGFCRVARGSIAKLHCTRESEEIKVNEINNPAFHGPRCRDFPLPPHLPEMLSGCAAPINGN